MILSSRIFPGDFLTVLIPSPDLLTKLIDHPLGVALLLGDVLAHWHLLHLSDGFLDIAYNTVLLSECFTSKVIITDCLDGWYVVTVCVSNNLTLSDRNGNTNFSCPLGAFSFHLVRADLCVGLIVQDWTILGNINTVVIVSITTVVSRTGNTTTCCQAKEPM